MGSQTEKIVQQLKAAGFSNNDISALFPDKSGTKDFSHEQHTKAPKVAATGAGTGGVLGGALGWLVGYWSLGHSRRRPIYSCGSDGRASQHFLGENYEDFIEDHTKRDGRNGLDPAMGDRRSRTDITRAVHGARLHIIRKFCVLIADPCSYRN